MNMKTNFNKGDVVAVDPSYSGWCWEGTIVGTHGYYICVRDQEDCVFDIEPELLELLEFINE